MILEKDRLLRLVNGYTGEELEELKRHVRFPGKVSTAPSGVPGADNSEQTV